MYSKTKENKEIVDWVKKYKPLTVLVSIKELNEVYEHNITVHYMKQYGIDNVRSSIYSDIILDSKRRNILEQDIKAFNYIDKYQSFNYFPSFIRVVENNLYTFFNNVDYISSDNKYNMINEELYRLHELSKKIKALTNNIELSNGIYSGSRYETDRKYIELVSILKDKELMNTLYYYDDGNIRKSSENILSELNSAGEKLGLSFKKYSLLLMNLIDFNITKKKELYALTKNETNLDIITYTVIGLTEEKIKLILGSCSDIAYASAGAAYSNANAYANAPPPYENNN
jgi:hypothetical protein